MDWQVIPGVAFGVALIFLFTTLRWVPKPFNWVIEINFLGGTRSYVWQPGLHLLWVSIKPFMFVRNKVDMAEKPVTIHMGMKDGLGRPDPVDFKDAKAGVLAQVIYAVRDPKKATYNVQESDLSIVSHDDAGQETLLHFRGYERATLNRIEAELRSFFGSFKFDDANKDTKRADIEAEVLRKVRRTILKNWGVEVLLVDIIDFVLDEKTAEIRQGRLAAKVKAEVLATEAGGEKRAAIIKAEGQRQATITIAHGEREATQLAGQGEQERLRAVAQAGLHPTHAAAYVLAQESARAIGKTNTTVIATSEGGNLSQLAGMAGMLKGVLGGGNANTPPATPTPSAPTSPAVPAPAPAGSPPAGAGTPQVPFSQRRRSGKP